MKPRLALLAGLALVAAAPARAEAPHYQSSPERRTVAEKDWGPWLGPFRAKLIPSLMQDFGERYLYQPANAALRPPGPNEQRVVFMGDSITDNWINADPLLFTGGLVDRGISGQTTPQMLVRFRRDVIDLHPLAVHIMAGTNDLAGNTGAATMETVQGNIESMAELARAHGIKVILASIPPAAAFPWSPDKRPVPQIAAFNDWLRGYARANGFHYVNYHAALATPEGAMKSGLASDGVHPTPAGYAVMRPLALAAISTTLSADK